MKDIKGYEKLYAVTEDGKVWSYPKIPQNPKGRWMKLNLDHGGYPMLSLSKNRNSKCYSVHRLVAETYLKRKDNSLQVNHKNGNKLDNRVENLEWCTAQENTNHAEKIGLRNYKGRGNPNYKDGKWIKTHA